MDTEAGVRFSCLIVFSSIGSGLSFPNPTNIFSCLFILCVYIYVNPNDISVLKALRLPRMF